MSHLTDESRNFFFAKFCAIIAKNFVEVKILKLTNENIANAVQESEKFFENMNVSKQDEKKVCCVIKKNSAKIIILKLSQINGSARQKF